MHFKSIYRCAVICSEELGKIHNKTHTRIKGCHIVSKTLGEDQPKHKGLPTNGRTQHELHTVASEPLTSREAHLTIVRNHRAQWYTMAVTDNVHIASRDCSQGIV